MVRTPDSPSTSFSWFTEDFGGVLRILAFVCGWKEEKRPCGKRGLTRLTSESILEDCAECDFSLSFLRLRALRCFL